MNILSLPSIRKFNREERTDNLLTDDEKSMLMKSFFENGDKSSLSDMKWDAPTFDKCNLPYHINAMFVA